MDDRKNEQTSMHEKTWFLRHKARIHIELAHHSNAMFELGQKWEKGKENERREVISLVWLDERREKGVDFEW